MSINKLLKSNGVNNKTLNLYCNSITTSDNDNTSRVYFEPNIQSTVNFTNPRSTQDDGGLYNWILEEDKNTATIYGQYISSGNNVDGVLSFQSPTAGNITTKDVSIISNCRSTEAFTNPNGNVYFCYYADILNGLIRLFWRNENNTADSVNDDKHFNFIFTYKK